MLIALLLAATAIRAGYGLAAFKPNEGLVARLGDDAEYDLHARNLIEGRGIVRLDGRPTAERLPGYPLFLAGVYGVFGHSYLAARIVQAVLGGISCVLLYVLVRRWWSSRVALMAAGLLAVWPLNVWLSGVLLSENLSVPGLLLVLLLVSATVLRSVPSAGGQRMPVDDSARPADEENAEGLLRITKWLLAGLAMAGLALVHPIMAGLAALLIVVTVVFVRRQGVLRWTCVLAMAIAFVLPVAGWMVRNRVKVGGLVLSSLGGKTLLGANNIITATRPRAYGYWVSEWSPPGVRQYVGDVTDELVRDRKFRDFALLWLWENPGYWARLAAFKLGRFYLPVLREWRSVEGAIYLISYGFVLLLAVGGGCVIWKARAQSDGHRFAVAIVSTVLAYYSVLVMVFWGTPRFRQGIEPLVLSLAAVGLVTAYDRFRSAGSAGSLRLPSLRRWGRRGGTFNAPLAS